MSIIHVKYLVQQMTHKNHLLHVSYYLLSLLNLHISLIISPLYAQEDHFISFTI